MNDALDMGRRKAPSDLPGVIDDLLEPELLIRTC